MRPFSTSYAFVFWMSLGATLSNSRHADQFQRPKLKCRESREVLDKEPAVWTIFFSFPFFVNRTAAPGFYLEYSENHAKQTQVAIRRRMWNQIHAIMILQRLKIHRAEFVCSCNKPRVTLYWLVQFCTLTFPTILILVFPTSSAVHGFSCICNIQKSLTFSFFFSLVRVWILVRKHARCIKGHIYTSV